MMNFHMHYGIPYPFPTRSLFTYSQFHALAVTA